MESSATFLGMTQNQFVKQYWQKKPLLIKQAFPGFDGMLNKRQLISLACQPEVESRLVQQQRNHWDLKQGPFKKSDFSKIHGKWSLLVQGVNYFLPEAHALLKQFNFIPYARLDDLMVSYAVDGGGVGPHFDSYDVFLLQGQGQRLWKISNQKNRECLSNAPMRILKKFKADEEWLLEAGDMLYLPPNYAHHGIAVGECMTYSIGFRAPSYQELISEFLQYLQNTIKTEGIYADPDLKVSSHPALLADDMIKKVFSVLKKIQFDQKEVADFLGAYLTLPKANLVLDSPLVPLKKSDFLRKAKKCGIVLDLKTQLLYKDRTLFINGESFTLNNKFKNFFHAFADQRETEIPKNLDKESRNVLYQMYLNGCLQNSK